MPSPNVTYAPSRISTDKLPNEFPSPVPLFSEGGPDEEGEKLLGETLPTRRQLAQRHSGRHSSTYVTIVITLVNIIIFLISLGLFVASRGPKSQLNAELRRVSTYST